MATTGYPHSPPTHPKKKKKKKKRRRRHKYCVCFVFFLFFCFSWKSFWTNSRVAGDFSQEMRIWRHCNIWVAVCCDIAKSINKLFFINQYGNHGNTVHKKQSVSQSFSVQEWALTVCKMGLTASPVFSSSHQNTRYDNTSRCARNIKAAPAARRVRFESDYFVISLWLPYEYNSGPFY